MESMVERKRTQIEEAIDGATGKICLPPCQIACPLECNIQRNHAMLALLPMDPEKATSQIIKIGDEVYEKNPFFLFCRYICGLCEKECNYKDQTGAIRRRGLAGFVAEHYAHYLETKPTFSPPTKEKVAVVGGGPAGLMCAYRLAQKGYRVTLLERSFHLGGALRYIPQYRLPKSILTSVIHNLLRVANIELRLGAKIGNGGKTLKNLKNEGFKAIFIATGTPSPRHLTNEEELVVRSELEGVMFGLALLFEVNRGDVPPDLYRGKKVIIIGGGNVAFDVARTARRLEGDVTVVCLENADKSSRDGIPADLEEIEGAIEEGVKIVHSRGVEEVISEQGTFKKIKCIKCTSVYDGDGRFSPRFDHSDVIYLDGDWLLITVGQGPERTFFQTEGLLNDKGRLDIDSTTLMSNLKEGVFIGGDARTMGFAMEAMKDGTTAAEAVDHYLKGEDLKVWGGREWEKASIPRCAEYKPQPPHKWTPVEERLTFEPFEKAFTLEEAVREAKRCLYCGPCKSCKACVEMELWPELPQVKINQDICSGCGICVPLCCYDAIELVEKNEKLVATIDELKCKGCGSCIAACPSNAIDDELRTKKQIVNEVEKALA